MPVKEIKIDLFDGSREGNKKFANLLDPGKWQQLVSEYDEGRGEQSLDDLLAELIESR